MVTRRAAGIQAMLRALGFVQAATEAPTVLENGGRMGKKRFSFPNHKLGLVAKDGAVSVLQYNTELGSGGIGGFMDDAIFVEEPRVVVIWSSHQGSEGCDAGERAPARSIRGEFATLGTRAATVRAAPCPVCNIPGAP